MIKELIHDPILLSIKSEKATQDDLQTAQDLLDTLIAHKDSCVGMAANMIGINKRIIAFSIGPVIMPMINPVIVKKSAEVYEADEGCLSLDGTRKTTRHQQLEVEYLDMNFTKQKQTFNGFPAQIIQHEIDHCDGIVI